MVMLYFVIEESINTPIGEMFFKCAYDYDNSIEEYPFLIKYRKETHSYFNKKGTKGLYFTNDLELIIQKKREELPPLVRLEFYVYFLREVDIATVHRLGNSKINTFFRNVQDKLKKA